jgi:hypothetical protein
MKRPLVARPAPGTTELLEALDRVLGGGIVIDAVPAGGGTALAASAAGARIVVAGLQTYLEHPDPGLGRPSGTDARPSPETPETPGGME